MASISEVTLEARCHCGVASYSFTLPHSAFPLKSAICHCGSCRRFSGHLFATVAVIPTGEAPDVSQLTAYDTSTEITRYFCPRCGASVWDLEGSEWEIWTGLLDKTSGLLNRVQLFVEDTKDGGAAVWLGDFERHWGHRTSELVTQRQLDEMTKTSIDNGADAVTARCHCGDISFTVSKADEKYPAGLDACTSCRKATGSEITAWATVSPARINMDGPLNLSAPVFGHYQTSPDVHRYFCKRCGATAFFFKEGRDSIDFGVGLLQAGGARAEELLAWEKYDNCVAYQEDAIDPGLVQGLVRNIQKSKDETTP